MYKYTSIMSKMKRNEKRRGPILEVLERRLEPTPTFNREVGKEEIGDEPPWKRKKANRRGLAFFISSVFLCFSCFLCIRFRIRSPRIPCCPEVQRNESSCTFYLDGTPSAVLMHLHL